jgi:hypothetical protein
MKYEGSDIGELLTMTRPQQPPVHSTPDRSACGKVPKVCIQPGGFVGAMADSSKHPDGAYATAYVPSSQQGFKPVCYSISFVYQYRIDVVSVPVMDDGEVRSLCLLTTSYQHCTTFLCFISWHIVVMIEKAAEHKAVKPYELKKTGVSLYGNGGVWYICVGLYVERK